MILQQPKGAEFNCEWEKDADENEQPELWLTVEGVIPGYSTRFNDAVCITEEPDALALIVATILDPARFKTYSPRTCAALIAAGAPWFQRCGLLPKPQTDPLEDMS